MEYDPLLAKLAVWAADARKRSIARMLRALREYDVGGIRTNIGFFRQILEDRDSAPADLHTGFIDEFLRTAEARAEAGAGGGAVAALVAAQLMMRRALRREREVRWRMHGREDVARHEGLRAWRTGEPAAGCRFERPALCRVGGRAGRSACEVEARGLFRPAGRPKL